MSMLKNIMMTAAAMTVCAGAAMAMPRDTVSYTNIDSDSTTTIKTFNVGAAYNVKMITVEGSLQEVADTTYAAEAVIRVNSPTGEQYVLQPFTQRGFTGTVNTSYTFQLPVESAATGAWQLVFQDLFDDQFGADSRWTNVKVTLNDGAPNAIDAGSLQSGYTRLPATFINTGDIKWYAFTVMTDIVAANFRYLDIDTEGNTLVTNNDTFIVLYDEKGTVVAFDDDDGSVNASQLTFGAGTRPAVPGGSVYDGRDGSLKAGKYYLAVKGWGSGDGAGASVAFATTSTSSKTGVARVNIRTNAGNSIFCPADFDRDGNQNLDDIFYFLNAWFAGCF